MKTKNEKQEVLDALREAHTWISTASIVLIGSANASVRKELFAIRKQIRKVKEAIR